MEEIEEEDGFGHAPFQGIPNIDVDIVWVGEPGDERPESVGPAVVEQLGEGELGAG